jgi:hypothetical protein
MDIFISCDDSNNANPNLSTTAILLTKVREIIDDSYTLMVACGRISIISIRSTVVSNYLKSDIKEASVIPQNFEHFGPV